MVLNPKFGPQLLLMLHNKPLKIVREFKYLGSMVAFTSDDIKIRKGQAWGAFWKIKNIWKTTNLPILLKVRLFKASCLSILLFGCETWTLT